MATDGRVVHHLKQLLPDKRNSVVLAGYQAVVTRGRDLVDGARQVKIHGKYVPVHAEIVNLLQFAVHADASEIVDSLSRLPAPPETCYVVHGELEASNQLRDRIAAKLGWVCVVPGYLERVRLDLESTPFVTGPGTSLGMAGSGSPVRASPVPGS